MIYGIVPAAGSSTRMRASGIKRAKQFLPLGGKSVLLRTVDALWQAGVFSGLVVVVPGEDVAAVGAELSQLAYGDRLRVVAGGAERQDSVYNGLQAVPEEARWIVVHDGVRPLVTPALVERVLAAAQRHGAATAALPVHDTIKRVAADGRVEATVDRTGLWAVQTPQAFAADVLRRAHERARAAGKRFTDDAGLVEDMGADVYVVPGDVRNIKLTRAEDFEVARRWLNEEEGHSVRVGLGYDVHRLVPDRPLILAGVRVPHTMGLLGHSDADVLAHAVMDGLLGAAALGDIGQHFPDTDPRYKGADSMQLLRQVVALLAEHGYAPLQVDAVLAAQRPRLAPHIPKMRENLAAALGVPVTAVSVKATTTEGLGFVGREEGIEARAVVTLRGCP